jgi:hypothetical protein
MIQNLMTDRASIEDTLALWTVSLRDGAEAYAIVVTDPRWPDMARKPSATASPGRSPVYPSNSAGR